MTATRRNRLLWTAIVAAPVAWATQLVLGSEYEELACADTPATGTVAVVGAISAITAVVAIAGILAALASLRDARGDEARDPKGTELSLATTALIASGLLVATIALGASQLFVFEGCAAG